MGDAEEQALPYLGSLMLANQEHCPHPYKRMAKIQAGIYQCKRCGKCPVHEGRETEIKRPRQKPIRAGDAVRVHGERGVGQFLYTEPGMNGPVAVLRKDSQFRTVHVDRVRRTK